MGSLDAVSQFAREQSIGSEATRAGLLLPCREHLHQPRTGCHVGRGHGGRSARGRPSAAQRDILRPQCSADRRSWPAPAGAACRGRRSRSPRRSSSPAIAINVYPFDARIDDDHRRLAHRSSRVRSAGFYVGADGDPDRRMDFVRFSGELAICSPAGARRWSAAGLAGDGVLTGRGAVRSSSPSWRTGCSGGPRRAGRRGLAGQAKQNVRRISRGTDQGLHRSPSCAGGRLVALIRAGSLVEADRHCSSMDAILLLVLCLPFTPSRPHLLAPLQFFDARWSQCCRGACGNGGRLRWRAASRSSGPATRWWRSTQRLVAGQLAWSAVLGGGFCAGRRPFAQLCGWQTRFLPAYLIWAGFVVLVVPPVFGFA